MASRKMMFVAMLLCLSMRALAEDPYLFFEWNVTYGNISPLGIPQQGILINGQFPGPKINCTSNNNIVVNCMSVLITADQSPKDYYFVASGRFLKRPLVSVSVVRYANGKGVPASPALPPPPPEGTPGIAWSVNQFRSFRWNLTASAARPNPQGSYHYGKINITRTIKIANSRAQVDGKLRFAINGVSHVDSETPLKLVEYFGLANKVFSYNLVKDEAPAVENGRVVVAPSVMNATFRNFVEIVFENRENTIQTWHLDGYSFFAVAIEPGRWSPEKRKNYNLSYLGQQMYVSVLSPNLSLRDEYNLPPTQQLCGIVKGLPDPAPYV
ncbi:SKU5 similar 14 [Striga hermonthica]|uniref:SKU5 similar 14 n=1 Tax=Striga hermonthica TaxID=68872 RepID=A0A9N7N3R4_STRHE|nr:SKU5 similar 14 [Striga hermonthica]